jgi:hypothetical protein
VRFPSGDGTDEASIGIQIAPKAAMQEKFYGLVREYLVNLRDRDLCEEQVRAAPEGIEREQSSCKLEVTRKRCGTLRREIRRYPEIKTLAHRVAPNNPSLRNGANPSLRHAPQAG